MPELTEDEIAQLRALLPQATPEEAAEIVEEAAEIIEEETASETPDEEVIEDAAEIITDATEIVEEEINEPISENSESGESDASGGPPDPDDAPGGVDIAPIVSGADDDTDGVPADSGYGDEPPRASHWWYRSLRRG